MRILKDELLGMADDPLGDVVFKNQCLNMDVLYRTGETPQVRLSDLYNDCNLCLNIYFYAERNVKVLTRTS